MHQPPAAMAAYSRELADVRREGRTFRVESLIAASRDCFDAADEREHLALADPEATKRHIASVSRKLGTGTIAASRTTTDVRPPKAKGPEANDTHGLDLVQIQAATRMNVPLADYAAALARHGKDS